MLNDARELVVRAREVNERRTAPLILELDLTEDILEAPPRDPVSMAMARRKLVLRGLTETLARAARDPRVRALVAKLGGTRMSLGRVQEIREALREFARSGKPSVAWAETFGEFGPGLIPYYLATGFDEIWLQPSGDVGFTGATGQAVFVHGTLDKLGVQPQIGRRHEYKSAPESFTHTEFTPASREAVTRLVSSFMSQLTEGVAAARGLPVDTVRELIDRGPVSAEQAREAGLVDQVGYRDEVYASVRERAGEQARLLYLSRYRKGGAAGVSRRVQHPSRPVIGLVYATGAIRQGRTGRGASGSSMGSDTISAAIRAAARDDRMKAIVLRVDSPGGSYIASDTIWREVLLARRGGTPVVVSMGDMAGSGAYYISMAADAIVAQPGTLTGSIGVYAGKAVVGGLLERAGVSTDTVSEGRHAQLFSALHPFSDQDWELLNTWLDRVYDDFVAKAAEGRGMSRDEMHEVARGRVWTGADALERHLVDELGGLARAVELAREKAGLRQPHELRPVPRLHPLDRLMPVTSSDDPASAARTGVGVRGVVGPVVTDMLESWGPVAHAAARLGLPSGGPLVVPPEYRLTW